MGYAFEFSYSAALEGFDWPSRQVLPVVVDSFYVPCVAHFYIYFISNFFKCLFGEIRFSTSGQFYFLKTIAKY